MRKKTPVAIAGEASKPLVIGGVEISCYVLDDETRVLSQRGLQTGIGMSAGGGSAVGERRINEFVDWMKKKGIDTGNLAKVMASPIEFRPGTGGRAYAYPATLLVDLCKVILEARDAGVLLSIQKHIAERADILIRGLATVGIIALVDEATGYQKVREQRALATILEKFIAKELQPWTKTFPYEFYEEIYRLRGWDGPHGHKRTPFIGRITNDIVYDRLGPGILGELRERNPVDAKTGRRKSTHHQWFTPDLGHPKLKEHLSAVMALMRASSDWKKFRNSLEKAFPKEPDND